jgi:hypothetical protein
MAQQDAYVVEGKLRVPYNNYFGAFLGRFFQEVRDHQRLQATRCNACNKVYMPPRSICPDCFAQLDQWVELPGTGKLVTYTVVKEAYGSYYQPMEVPYALGIIKLDGADTAMCHLLGEVSHDNIQIGMNVKPVFREERKGNILDIAYFKPA